MKRIGRKYILILLMFLTTLLCAVGSSTWIILSEKRLSTPTFTKIDTVISGTATIKASDNTDTKIYSGEQAKITGLTVMAGDVTVTDCFTISYDTTGLTATGEKDKLSATTKVSFKVNDAYKDIYNEPDDKEVTINLHQVAYNSDTYYSTVNLALGATSGTTVVIPSNHDTETGRAKNAKTITSNATIPNGVTLSLPYNTNGKTGSTEDELIEATYKNAYNDASTLLKNLVTLNAALTVDGTITVGGTLNAGGGGYYAGQTCDSYAQLTLGTNGRLNVNGTVNSFGFIEGHKNKINGVPTIVFNNGSILLMPFVLYEFRGGTVSSALQKSDKTFYCTPFLRFSFVNIIGSYRINYGATAKARASLTASSMQASADSSVVSSTSTSLLQLSNSSSNLDVTYTPWSNTNKCEGLDTKNKPINDIFGKLSLSVNGDAILNSLYISVKKSFFLFSIDIEVSSKNAYLPVSYIHDITINGNLDISKQDVAILPGGNVTITEKGSLNGNNLIVYNSFVETGAGLGDEQSTKRVPYPRNYTQGNLTVNGSLILNNLGGEIKTTKNGATIEISETMSVTTIDLLTSYSSSSSTPKEGTTAISNIFNSSLTLDASKVDLDSEYYATYSDCCVYFKPRQVTTNLENYNNTGNPYTSTGTYYSKDGAWYSTGFTVKLDANGGTNSSTTTVTKDVLESNMGASGGYVVKVPSTSRAHYTFSHWCKTQNCTAGDSCEDKFVSGTAVFEETTLYAHWILNTYTLSYEYVGLTGETSPELPEGLQTAFSIESDDIYLPTDLTFDGYMFTGWYYDKACQNPVNLSANDTVSAEVLCSKISNAALTLYGEWSNADIVYTYTVILTNGNEAPYSITQEFTVNKLNYNPTDTDNERSFTDTNNNKLLDKDENTIGYYFAGWYLDETYEKAYAPNTGLDIGNGETRTLYAKWNEKVSIKIIAHDDSTETIYAMPGTDYTPTTPSRNGYEFAEWTLSENLGDTLGKNESISLPTDDGAEVSFTENWALIDYTITYVFYDVVFKTNITISTHNNSVTYNIETPITLSKDDVSDGTNSYYVLGWYSDSTYSTSITTISGTEDKTVYAQCQHANYRQVSIKITGKEYLSKSEVTYDTTSISNDATIYVAVGTEITVTAKPNSDTNGDTPTVTIKSGTSTKSNPYTILTSDTSISITIEGKEKSSSGGTCLAEGAMITMADGTKRAVQDIRKGDVVMSFNHLTGELTTNRVIIVVRTASDFYKNTFIFDDGTKLATINEHGIFDLDLNKYVNIDHLNYHEYIGHNFVSIDSQGNIGTKKLVNVISTYESGYKYDIVTNETLNYVAEDTLSVTHVLVDIINTFEFGEDLKFDAEKMQADIEKYGLYTYDEWAEYCDISVFEEYNIPIMKIGVLKGLYAEEYIIYLINTFVLDDSTQIT